MGEMDFSTYQAVVAETSFHGSVDSPITYPTLGLVNEAGELAGKVKKLFRDHGGELTDERRQGIILEMGDVLWYLGALANALDVSLDDVMAANVAKVHGRVARGTLAGDGDTR